jgi:hypothetical protein
LNIYDVRSFANAFNKVYSEITNKKSAATIGIGVETFQLNKYINSSSVAFTKPDEQTIVAEEIKKRMEKYKYVF